MKPRIYVSKTRYGTWESDYALWPYTERVHVGTYSTEHIAKQRAQTVASSVAHRIEVVDNWLTRPAVRAVAR